MSQALNCEAPPAPKLWLHKVHHTGVAAHAAPEPTTEAVAATFLGASFGVHLANIDLQKDCLLVVFEGRNLAVQLKDGQALTIPLAFAGVSLGQDMHTNAPLIILGAGRRPHVWLMLVDGDESAGSCLMSMMAQRGAMRSDFDQIFSMAPWALASGSNGAIYELHQHGRSNSGSEEVVAKIGFASNVEPEGSDEIMRRDVRTEVDVLASFQGHPNIIGFHGLFFRVNSGMETCEREGEAEPRLLTQWAIVLEYCPGGDLFNASVASPFSEPRAQEVTKSLLSALSHIHFAGVVHRDLKPENVLLRDNGQCVLADFGISCHIADQEALKQKCGSPGYAAPEVLLGKAYDTKVDCFSLGSLVFFVLAGFPPFHGPSLQSMLRRTTRCRIDVGAEGFRTRSSECKRFIFSLLMRDPSERLSAEDAFQTPWIRGADLSDGPPSSCNMLAHEGSSAAVTAEPDFTKMPSDASHKRVLAKPSSSGEEPKSKGEASSSTGPVERGKPDRGSAEVYLNTAGGSEEAVQSEKTPSCKQSWSFCSVGKYFRRRSRGPNTSDMPSDGQLDFAAEQAADIVHGSTRDAVLARPKTLLSREDPAPVSNSPAPSSSAQGAVLPKGTFNGVVHKPASSRGSAFRRGWLSGHPKNEPRD